MAERKRVGSQRLLIAALLCALLAAALAGRQAATPARAQGDGVTPTPGAGPPQLTPTASTTATAPARDAGADQIIIFPTPTRTPTPINIGNFVWDDLDRDGRQDAGEPGLAGVTVQLWNATKTQLIDSDVTSASGGYTLVAPLPGNYRVRVVLPAVLDQFSPKDQAGGDDTDDSDINPSGTNLGFTDVIAIASNVISITSIDAGIIVYRPPTPTRTPTPINIGNFVWYDIDADGIQDAGEPGLANITVQLWNAAQTQLLDTATTNASGSYTLVAPLPGDYRVRVLPPTGAGFAPKDAGADDTRDSDINRLLFTSVYGFTDVISLASNVISITRIDAGLINVPPTPTGTLFTATPTATQTRTPTATPAGPSPLLDERLHLPLLRS